MPINLMTINTFFGRNFSPDQAKAFLATKIIEEPHHSPNNFKEKALSLVGRELI
jgi:UDP-galactopyranose mutase